MSRPAAAVEGLRLSPCQSRLWALLGTGDPGASPFVAQVAVELDGALDLGVLEERLAAAARRHEMLRTLFPRPAGLREPVQVVGDPEPVYLRRLDAVPGEGSAGARALLEAERRQGFDLAAGPVLRAAVAALPGGGHLLILSLPALAADGGTLATLLEGVLDLPRPPAGDPVQHYEFSEWQHELLADEEAADGRRFWQERCPKGAGTLRLPGLRAADGRSPFRPEVVPAALDATRARRFAEVAAGLRAAPEELLLACWLTLLRRLGGAWEGQVGRLASARDQEDLAGVLGPLSWHVPVGPGAAPPAALGELVGRVAGDLDEASSWKECWLAVAAAGGPEPEAGFAFTPWPRWRGGPAGRAVVRAQNLCLGRFAVELSAWWQEDGLLALDLRFDPARLDRPDAEFLSERLLRLIDALLAHRSPPEAAPGRLPLLDDVERGRLLTAAAGAARPYPLEGGVLDLFEERVRRAPGAPAVLEGRRTTSYGELAGGADALGRRLAERGAGPERLVGLHLERSTELLTAVLAVWRTGAAFLPLDPDDPPERTAGILRDAAPALIVTAEALRGRLPEEVSGRALAIAGAEGDENGPGGAGEGATPRRLHPDGLAYVLFTSGSTGRPKGVAVPHRGLTNYLCWCRETYPVPPGSRVPLHSPVAFDLTLTSLLLPLVTGGAVEVVPPAGGLDALGEAVEEGAPDLVKLTPSHLELLASRAGWEGGRGPGALVLGGEALRGESVGPWRRRRPDLRLFNEYGPTEAVVGCVAYEIPPGEVEAGPVPIGAPIANARAYLLDEHLAPVPQGVPGEIWVGGVGLARGYLGRPGLTAERFVPDPWSGERGARLYRTGDLGAARRDGALEYLGRVDHQVKIRGVRVEPGEVEAALRTHPAVREAVVTAPPGPDGRPRLVAYLVTASPPPDASALREHLARRLIEPMIPSAFEVLDALPLTASGKVDRGALPAPGSARPELAGRYEAPRNAGEETLAAIFAEALGLDRVGVHDSF
ncbi:MAG TPA: amino acid adenylation domain-containing protein, partial [Thermoanaerobaculia bacterium]|nr:amino acid adenylation domain-containing protein [Thermoanaerobaculia bacterium]